jgi:type II secretory pathway component PulF
MDPVGNRKNPFLAADWREETRPISPSRESVSMSRDAGESDPLRRPRRQARRSEESDPRQSEDDELNTFRPAPRRAKAGSGRSPEEVKWVPPGPNWFERILFGRVSSGQLAVFARQFAAYLDAGVDIIKTLGSLEKQFHGTALGPVVERMQLGIRRGSDLAEVVSREPQAFDALFVSMIKVAEARGGVPETLRRLANHYEARQRLIRQARSAAIYPVIVLIMAAGVVTLLTVFLLPMFAEMLSQIVRGGGQLPLPSRVLMAFSRFMRVAGWWVIPAAFLGIPVLLYQLYKTPAGKQIMDRIALRLPVFGQLLYKIDTTRFARALSSLLGAGVDVGSSLDLTADVVRLSPIRGAVRDARSAVMQGTELSSALNRSRRFTPDVIAIIDSGEETGKLPETLEHLADDYEEQVTYMVRNLGQLVQPMLLIMLGGLVLFIILAVLLPYISILTSLGQAGAGGGG